MKGVVKGEETGDRVNFVKGTLLQKPLRSREGKEDQGALKKGSSNSERPETKRGGVAPILNECERRGKRRLDSLKFRGNPPKEKKTTGNFS